MSVELIGVSFPETFAYGPEERAVQKSLLQQIDQKFPTDKNVLISLTWLGPQFLNHPGWSQIVEYDKKGIVFDNIFLLATVDPPYLNVFELQTLKKHLKALKIFYLGNFDSPHQFNFFAAVIGDKFKKYHNNEIILTDIDKIYVNYNRKPRIHRVEFVKKLIEEDLLKYGTVTLGKDATNDLYLTLNEKDEDYVEYGNAIGQQGFGLPHDMYSLHRIDIWQKTFLCVVAATEFNPIENLFCQQDTFKPIIGLRPFVINGDPRTYRWLRINGFKTFNHYWPHIDIEGSEVHTILIQLIKHLKELNKAELINMYNDMLPNLIYNKERFFEFAGEQRYKIDHLFD